MDIAAAAAAVGAAATEVGLWADLAGTADRGDRAEVLAVLADHAAERVGGQAAETLACLAAAETHLACEAAGHPHPYRWLSWPPPRRVTYAVCAVIAAVLLVPGLSVWARMVLVVGVLGAAGLAVCVLTRRANRQLCGLYGHSERDQRQGVAV